MSTIPLKRDLTEAEIDDFLNEVENKRLDEIKEQITADDLAVMSTIGQTLVDSVQQITKFPSKFAVDAFIKTSRDESLLEALKNPYIQLALNLKQIHDLDSNPFLTSISKFNERNTPIFEETPLLKKFTDEAGFYLPPLPKINNEALAKQFSQREVSSNITSIGSRFYYYIAAEIINERLYHHQIEEILIQVENNAFARHWCGLYGLNDQEDLEYLPKDTYHEIFYSYIGALVSSYQQSETKQWLTILLEPVLSQFTDSETNESVIESLEEKVPDADFDTIFVSSHKENPVYIVQYLLNSLVLGTGSSTSQKEARALAATNALHDSQLFNKIAASHSDVKSEHASTDLHQSAVLNGSDSPTPTQQQQLQKQQHQYQQLHQIPQGQVQPQQVRAQQIGIGNLNRPGASPPAPIQTSMALANNYPQDNQASVIAPKTAGVQQNSDTSSKSPVDIYDCPDPGDELEIDNSYKERLNQFLCQKKLPAAEYKTSKVNNSEVQVTCFVSGKPITRASSTNKKKAGQWAAKFCFEYFEYFAGLHKLIGN